MEQIRGQALSRRRLQGQALKMAADMHAKALGFTTLTATAEELNRRQVPTPRGGKKWHLTSVSRLIARLGLKP